MIASVPRELMGVGVGALPPNVAVPGPLRFNVNVPFPAAATNRYEYCVPAVSVTFGMVAVVEDCVAAKKLARGVVGVELADGEKTPVRSQRPISLAGLEEKVAVYVPEADTEKVPVAYGSGVTKYAVKVVATVGEKGMGIGYSVRTVDE